MPTEEKEKQKPKASDEEVLGKAYDGRLMRRLLTYLRPYKLQAGISIVAVLLKAGADVIGPLLTKVAIDQYMSAKKPEHPFFFAKYLSARHPATGGHADRAGLPRHAHVSVTSLSLCRPT